MRILIACDSFKGTLSSADVAHALGAPLRAAGHTVTEVPIADGGDGTIAALSAAGFNRHPLQVTGPLGAPTSAAWAQRGPEAIIEIAQAVGLDLVDPSPDSALRASSQGVGELILAAVDAGCTAITLGLGGSATTDGGTGMLTALGARFLTAAGDPVAPGGQGLADISNIDLSPCLQRCEGIEFSLAADVSAPLYGTTGAAAVFGPQKGADTPTRRRLDAGLRNLAHVAESGLKYAQLPGAGAAGGIGWAGLWGLGARYRSGAEFVFERLGFAAHLAAAELVITGEGRFDAQTLQGKAPSVILAQVANASSARSVIVCGSWDDSATRALLEDAGVDEVYALTDYAPAETCMRDPAAVLATVATALNRAYPLA